MPCCGCSLENTPLKKIEIKNRRKAKGQKKYINFFNCEVTHEKLWRIRNYEGSIIPYLVNNVEKCKEKLFLLISYFLRPNNKNLCSFSIFYLLFFLFSNHFSSFFFQIF